MRIHIISVGTAFMSGIALLARREGHEVTGSDNYIVPKIREQLEAVGVAVTTPFKAENLADRPDLVILGNDIYPENEELIELYKCRLKFVSGSSWFAEYVLRDALAKNKPLSDEDEKSKKETLENLAKHAPKVPDEHESIKHAPKVPGNNEPGKVHHTPPPVERGLKKPKRIIH